MPALSLRTGFGEPFSTFKDWAAGRQTGTPHPSPVPTPGLFTLEPIAAEIEEACCVVIRPLDPLPLPRIQRVRTGLGAERQALHLPGLRRVGAGPVYVRVGAQRVQGEQGAHDRLEQRFREPHRRLPRCVSWMLRMSDVLWI